MIRCVFLIITALLIFSTLTCSAAETEKILILQSADIKPYKAAASAFEQHLKALINKSGSSPTPQIKLTILTKDTNRIEFLKNTATLPPRLIVAVGSRALALAGTIENIPIIFLMVPQPPDLVGQKRRDITGVIMDQRPQDQLRIFHDIFPYIKKIGVIYDPGRTGQLVQAAKPYAEKLGLTLISQQELHSWEIPKALQSLKGEIDAFWMLPDTSVITPQTVKSIMLFSIKNKIPILTFSGKYLVNGATVAIDLDEEAMGEQAAQLAVEILSNAAHMPPQVQATKTRTTVNHKVVQHLGIVINPAFITTQ